MSRMLRSAPLVWRGALLSRGPLCIPQSVGPGSAEQREERCTASGTPKPATLNLEFEGLALVPDVPGAEMAADHQGRRIGKTAE